MVDRPLRRINWVHYVRKAAPRGSHNTDWTRMGKWTRRALLTSGTVVGGGMLLGAGFFAFAPDRLGLRPAQPDGLPQLAVWLKITPANEVIAIVPHADLGQGAQTALAMMLAEELEADWDTVRVEQAPATGDYANGHVLRGFMSGMFTVPQPLVRGVEYAAFRVTRQMGFQITGGSLSVRSTGQYGMRVAGAAAQAMLRQAAADRWQVPIADCIARLSRVTHAASGRSATFGELASDAALLDLPAHPPLKNPAAFTIVGTSRRRFDLPAKVDGSATYAVDVRRPGMLYAAAIAAPVFGGRLTSVDADTARRMPGVRKVVELDDAVAVVADSWWQARNAVHALTPQFTDGGHGDASSDTWFSQQAKSLESLPGKDDLERGDTDKALKGPLTRVTAQYRVPFLHHATMEPMSATVCIADGRCEVWTGVQDPLNTRHVVAKLTGLDSVNVTVHNQVIGGGFGRRLPRDADYVEQATRIAMAAAPAPVNLIWSREEDTRHGFYRPAVSSNFEGGVDATGHAVAWRNRYSGMKEGRAAHPLYAIANVDIRHLPMQSHVHEGPWRSVTFSHQGFFVESFADELAHAAKRDPLEFRLEGLANRPRHRAVLERVGQMSKWSTPLGVTAQEAAAGLRRGRGVALLECFGSIVAEVCEVAVDASGAIRVERVFAVVDCGIVVNPDNARAQIEGGVLFGLSAALGERITIDQGRVVQSNFHDYPLLRLPDAPQVEVEFIASAEAPGGLGEPGTAPIAAALANAVFAASGRRIRELPVTPA